VTRAPAVMSDRYFQARALASQLGAWASPQSRPLESRAVLEENVAAAAARFAGRAVERPPFWGGYLVFPECVEFWLGQSARLHDRFLYRRQGESWLVDRLGP
jgi:pyridoxamine 5'-phosphate oxidase